MSIRIYSLFLIACFLILQVPRQSDAQPRTHVTLNKRGDGYRGIWYMNQPSNDEYVYKYSGGLGTYCAKHKPFAIYCKEVNKTFFCYGGTTKNSNRKLLHMVSYFDHATKTVPRPIILLDKQTSDAHDNPVISVDAAGHIWIFSTSHGTARPSYIHRSVKPYKIDQFALVPATRLDGEATKRITNFSYMQAWCQKKTGFQNFFTRYGDPAKRTICYMNSRDGVHWSRWRRIAAIDDGHYQISGIGKSKAGSMFNYHPAGKGLNWRTNLYYVETANRGATWRSVDGRELSLPLTKVHNKAIVHDYESEGLNVYLKDIRFDENDRPVLLYVTSKGYESGPKNDPRTWTIARWMGEEWLIHPITKSDNNYDFGELWMLAADDWRVIGPTESGPQPYNPGGEVAMWSSRDQGATWTKTRQLTRNSLMNHTYVRRVLDAHPDFIAIWADGHGRQPSESRLHFSDIDGNVFQLPTRMDSDEASPTLVSDQKKTTAKAQWRRQRVTERRRGVHLICHRGAVEFAHENTLEAYRAAFELGADGNEIDIRATKDGVLVCFHDDMVDHLLDAYGDVSDYNWDELQKVPFRNPGRFGKFCRIPTLREAFELHHAYAGLMHLDVKRPGLVESISELLDELDMWEHVVQAPTDFANQRYRPTRGKVGLYLDRSEVDNKAIAAALEKPGERITLEYPQGVATVLGRKVSKPSDQPVANMVAVWATQSSLARPQDERTVEQLLNVLRSGGDWRTVARGAAAEAESANKILQRAKAADELARRSAATPEVFETLVERVHNRSLHRNWRYCGLDGIAAFRALAALKAPHTVAVARYCLWRDDPAVEAARNPAFNHPRSWTDWRTKVNVFRLLESVPGAATEQLCRDYLSLNDIEARTIGVLQFEAAGRTLLTIQPSLASVKELLGHRLRVVRGRAILFCLANADEAWAMAALKQLAPHALTYLEPRRVRIALVGDSTVASYPNPPADRPDLTGWGQVLPEFFHGDVKVINQARSGRSSKSFIREGYWKKTLALKPDYVFIQFGHNDQPGKGDRTTDPEGDFRDYLRQYITDATENGIRPILVTPMTRRRFDDGKVKTTLGPWAAAMRTVANEHKVPLVDLHKASVQFLNKLGDKGSADLSPSKSDRTHFSRKGALAMARLVVAELSKVEPNLKGLIRK